jgi:hypothetical protein
VSDGACIGDVVTNGQLINVATDLKHPHASFGLIKNATTGQIDFAVGYFAQDIVMSHAFVQLVQVLTSRTHSQQSLSGLYDDAG